MSQASIRRSRRSRSKRTTHKTQLNGTWEARVHNQGAQCEYENVADELMKDQFIAGLVSELVRVKLIVRDHRHKDSSEMSYQRQPRQQHLPANSKKLGKCGILGHFAAPADESGPR